MLHIYGLKKLLFKQPNHILDENHVVDGCRTCGFSGGTQISLKTRHLWMEKSLKDVR